MKSFYKIVILISLSLVLVLGYFFRDRIKQYVPWQIKSIVNFIDKGSIRSIRVCICDPDKQIWLKRDDGLEVAGSIYGLGNDSKRPGIILLHGNTPMGRELAIYKILARNLAKRKYLVLAIDLTGHGKSDDPFRLGSKEALNHDKDVHAALDYLKTLEIINKERIFIIGHSGGCGAAFNVGIKDQNIRKIVAIGPPRRVTERLNDPDDIEYFWKRALQSRKQVYNKEFPSWYTKEYWINRVLSSDMKQYLEYFSTPSHKPLFLIDGELEPEEDKRYLQRYYQNIVAPKKYLTISDSDHYFNSVTYFAINVYHEDIMNKVIDEIDTWLKL